MSMDQVIDLEEQYDKIYRYCYLRLHNRETAEDITQETFLRFFASDSYLERGQALRYLYTIARNLCVDEYRRHRTEQLVAEMEEIQADEQTEEKVILTLGVKTALEKLNCEQRELLFLRYVNEVPIHTICGIFQISRFAVYRKLRMAVKNLEDILREEKIL